MQPATLRSLLSQNFAKRYTQSCYRDQQATPESHTHIFTDTWFQLICLYFKTKIYEVLFRYLLSNASNSSPKTVRELQFQSAAAALHFTVRWDLSLQS